MGIKVNTYQLQSKAAYAESLSCQLEAAENQLHSLYYSLDSQVKSRRGIGSTMRNLEQRIEKSQQKMYNISKYLAKAAADYNAAEAAVGTMAARLGAVNATGAASIGWTSAGGYAGAGAATGKVEGKKWYEGNLFKIAVGAVVIGVAIGVAILAAPAVAAVATAAATGAAIGALVGGITAGVVSSWHGGKFVDGFANGFMWGSIGGAVSGIVSGSVAAAVGAKAVVGAVGKTAAKWIGIGAGSLLEGISNAGLYVAQTRYEGGQITATGLGVSFVVAAGFSAIGGILSGVGKGAKEAVADASDDTATKAVSEAVENGNVENKLIQGLDNGGKALDDVAKGSRISPSQSPDLLATPNGVKTKVNYNDPDLDNVRSLIRENEAADTLAKNGYNIEQNPIVPGNKNPDYLIENTIFDCYSPKEGTSVRNVASNIAQKIGSGQTNRIVLNLDDWHGGGGNIEDIINQLKKWPITDLKEVKIINHYHEVIDIYP